MAEVQVWPPLKPPSRRIGFMRSTKWPKARPTSCGARVTTMPPSSSPIPASLRAERKTGPAWIPVSPTKAARPSDVISAMAPSGMRPNRGKLVRRCPTRSPATGAQGDLDPSDREGEKHADDPAEEDCEAHHHEVDGRARRDNDADVRGRPLHDGLRANDAKQVATLQHELGRDRQVLGAT